MAECYCHNNNARSVHMREDANATRQLQCQLERVQTSANAVRYPTSYTLKNINPQLFQFVFRNLDPDQSQNLI